MAHQQRGAAERFFYYKVKNIPIAAIVIITAVPQPKIRNKGELTRVLMTLGLLVSSVTSTIKGGARTPLRTAE